MKKSGFTLLELIIGMAIFSIVIVVIVGFFGASFRILYAETNRSSLRTSMESALYGFSKELISAKQVNAKSATAITFWSDYDYDTGQDTNEVFTYSLSSGKLVRTVNGTSKNLIYGVTVFNLTYDSVQPDDVRLVAVTLTATSGGDSLTMKDQIRLRNKFD
jgi:prepilin-type N-terminal cleavage/methylation domain-containing protein